MKNRLAEYGVNVSSYVRFLKGNDFTANMLSIDYNNVTVDISDYIKGYRIYFTNGSVSKFDSGLGNVEKKLLTYVSFNGFVGDLYQFHKCFALNIPRGDDIFIFRVLLSNDVFPNGIRPPYKGMRVFFHVPQQLSLSRSWQTWVWKVRARNESYKMRFIIENITIMKKRDKEDSKCYQSDNNYDDWVARYVKNKAQCNNPYQEMDDRLPMCTTQEMMQKALFSEFIVETENLERPCKTMQAIHRKHLESNTQTPDRENLGEFWLSLSFAIPTFKEIEQKR